jgi:tetraprenyl-beta-curcumene synthase
MAVGALNDRRLLTRTSIALLLANVRYWSSVAPVVRTELRRWRACAAEIEDADLRALAMSKLRQEGFHADAAAMVATLAPRAHRRSVVEAIVALELLFDYLDGLTERPSSVPLRDGERFFRPLIDAVVPALSDSRERGEASGYPESLSRAVARAIARLPAAAAIGSSASRTASRTAQAQTRIHAIPQIGSEQLEEWAASEAQIGRLEWRELVAGAGSSVLVLHALIAAAADPSTTAETAAQIEAAYLPTCIMLTLLDGLVDYERDLDSGDSRGPGYIGLYEDRNELPELLCQSARRAVLLARALDDGPHHVMLLAGIVAYYSTAPGAENEIARPAMAQLRCELAPLISPTLAVMRIWRGVRRRMDAASSFSLFGQHQVSLVVGREESR